MPCPDQQDGFTPSASTAVISLRWTSLMEVPGRSAWRAASMPPPRRMVPSTVTSVAFTMASTASKIATIPSASMNATALLIRAPS